MDKSVWRSIVDNIVVPSMDASSSACDLSEDEATSVEIFQRPPGLSLTLPEDSNDTDTEDPPKDTGPDTTLASNVKSSRHPITNGTVLSFARLEHLDLDDFQNTIQDEQRKPNHALTELRDIAYDKYKADLHQSIMDKLITFCEGQLTLSSKSTNNLMGIPPEENTFEEKQHPTVNIDLRRQNQTGSTPTLSSAPCSFHKQAKQFHVLKQVHTDGPDNCWEETGKSMLLRQIRDNNKRCESLNKNVVGMTTNKRDLEIQPKSRHHLCGISEFMKPSTGCQNRTSKTQRDLRKQNQLIGKGLKKCQSRKSTGLKRPAAERTDVLYDMGASSLEPIRTMPADFGNNDAHMMLTVNLSSPGMVIVREKRKRQKLDSALTQSHIYNTLVAWFLSLVPSNPNSINEANAAVPFWVTGLQQVWTEHGLALHAFVLAKHTYALKRKDSDRNTPFHNHIYRFLSETSLPTVAYWVPQLNSIMGKDKNNTAICLPSYCLNVFISATSDTNAISRIFSLSPGFHWHTPETSGHGRGGRETTQEQHAQVSVALGCNKFFGLPLIMHCTVQILMDSGSDICGLRLLYPSPEHLAHSFVCKSILEKRSDLQCILAVAVRGPRAHALLQGINQSVESLVRQVIAAEDVPDLFPLFTPRQLNRAHKELCLWFSGRPVSNSGQDHGLPSGVLVPAVKASFLCAAAKDDVFLVVSSLIPPSCYGKVLSTCERRGFVIRGLQRLGIHNDKASLLRFTRPQAQTFCLSASQTCQCLMLILKKENARHHSITLPQALMKELKGHSLLTCSLTAYDDTQTSLCFHTAPYNKHVYQTFARLAVPSPSPVVLFNPKRPLDLEMHELVVLTLCGQDTSQGLDLLHRAVTEYGFELLGLKWLPALTRVQAQEVSPYEIGDKCGRSALVTLMSTPALVCPLRQVDALNTLRKLLPNNFTEDVGVWMSPTPQVATRQIALFFSEQELIPDKKFF